MRAGIFNLAAVLLLVLSVGVVALPQPVVEAGDPPCTCGDICVNQTGWWRNGGAFNSSATPIQDAVNNATGGDVICVKDGNYNENVDVSTANLTIQSENGTTNCVINASNSNDHVFHVAADRVNITGLTVENATGDDKAGIYLDAVDYCTISGNNVTNNNWGIYLVDSGNNTLRDNTAWNNSYGIILDAVSASSSNNKLRGNTARDNANTGFIIADSSHCNLTGNTARDNVLFGIYLVRSSNNTLTGNNAGSNGGLGIYLDSSSSNMLINNTANSNSFDGIYLWASSHNDLVNNTANWNNWNGTSLLSSSNNNLTDNNAISNSNIGIRLKGSNSNTLTANTAANNTYGIYLASSSGNTIYNNYFNNTNNAWDNANNGWNITRTAGTNIIGGPYLGGNYWSDYAGSDTTHDGLGDTLVPYNSTGNITHGGDYLPLVPVIYADIVGTVYEANTSLLGGADVVLKLGGSEVANTTSNATGYYNFTVNQTGNYTVNVTKDGFTSSERWANVTTLGWTSTVDFKGMDAPYRTAPDGLYVIKCSNLWLWGGGYPQGFALTAERVSDVLYAWTHPS
jgi:parallel beta-helix repeat protein